MLDRAVFDPLQHSGFNKSFSFRGDLYLLVLQKNCYYLSSKKLLGNHGLQVGNFPSLAQCLYCSVRNAVVVLTLQWLGRNQLWSTTWSQTPSDMPCRVPTTASLAEWRQSEMYNKICLKMFLRGGSVENKSEMHSREPCYLETEYHSDRAIHKWLLFVRFKSQET